MKPEVKNVTPVEPVKDAKEEILERAIDQVKTVDSTKSVTVIVHLLNVREHANSESAIVGQVMSGNVLKVNTQKVGDFYQVIEPIKGYVKSEFVG